VIRVAAVGDTHFGVDSLGTLRRAFEQLPALADVFLLAGDLTRIGHIDEIRVLVDELADLPVPCVAVLGNHDFQSDQADLIVEQLEIAGITVLEGSATVLDIRGTQLGIAGTKGFGGGFAGACGSDFGEPEMKAFVRHTKQLSDALHEALEQLDTDVRLALLHYAPVKDTLRGERPEIYPFLGSYLLGEAIDHAGADLVLHGHAHHGAEHGVTPGGIPVRNVALPVIGQGFKIYCFDEPGELEDATLGTAAPHSG
jgi:Icc-related predicted phosphoesterase